MQRACAQSTTWPSAHDSGSSSPLPVQLCGLLQIQGLQLHGGCGPLLWLVHCESTNQPRTGKRSTHSKAANTATGNKASSSDRCRVYTTPPETPAVTLKAPLKFNRPAHESLGDENEPLLDKDTMPHIISAESPDKKSKCCDKLNETGSPNESPLEKTPPDNPRTPPRRSQREKRPPGLHDVGTTFDSDSPPRSTTTSSD